MLILIVSLIVLAVVAAVAGVIRNRHLRKQVESGELEAMPETVQVDSECCGQHEVCEKEFYTMQAEDVAGWVRSLQLRGIALPDNLKDEVFLVVGELRANPHKK